jgi:hypothetical protein
LRVHSETTVRAREEGLTVVEGRQLRQADSDRLLQILRMLLLLVLQVRLGCLLWDAEQAEVVAAAE